MDGDTLPTSPRKKLKAYHDPQPTMADSTTSDMPSSTGQNHCPTNPSSSGENRLDKEIQCGIIEYVSPHLPGFEGILKKRYTDFLVNEILPNGQVIHLDNVQKPSDQKQLSQAASRPSHQQSSHSAQAPAARKDETKMENVPPRFEPTDLNKVEQGPRKKETVYMRHGADTLSLVDKQDRPVSEEAKDTPTAEQKAEAPCEKAPEPSEVGDGNIEGVALVHAEGPGGGLPNESKAPKDGGPEDAETPRLNEPDAKGTVGGWQAYAGANTDGTKFALSEEDRTMLNSFFSAETVDQILALFRRIVASPLRKARDFGTVRTEPIERHVRTNIHQAIRRIFSSRLETTTDDSGAMVVAAAGPSSGWDSRKNNGRSAGRNDRNVKPQQPKGKLGWAELGGDYLHFTIYKQNRDTMEVISHLARVLKLRPQLFQFAGTKDRRGITVQRASVYRVQANRLFDAGRTLKQSRIGNFEYRPQGLQLGELLGNEFLITLRDCHFQVDEHVGFETKIGRASSILNTVIEKFSSLGFINFYGLQRFGSFSTGTHTVGRSMLQGDFKAACEAILSFHPSALAAAQQESNQEDSSIDRDDKARAFALHTFATTQHSKQALDQLPRKFSAEACLIRHLSSSHHRNDYLGALQTINRNLRLMYVHAYQSLVWNIAATARWKAHGDKVLPGDLVLINEHPEASTKPTTDDAGMKVDQDGEPIIAPESSDRAYTSDEIFTRARVLTESELASPDCKISIFDIVLPLPGYDILYPANDTANIYKEFMGSEEGGGLDPYDMRRKWKDVSLSGGYRKLLAKPLGKVEGCVRAYGARGEDEQFVETDAERLIKRQGTEKGSGWEKKGGKNDGDYATKDEGGRLEDPSAETASAHREESKTFQSHTISATDATAASSSTDPPAELKNDKLAVILKMSLGSSTYATMALRELMKEGGVKTWKVEYSGGR